MDATYTGSMSFSLDVAGAVTGATFDLGDYSLTDDGSFDIDRTIITKDLDGTNTRTELGDTTVSWTKTRQRSSGRLRSRRRVLYRIGS